MRAGAKLTVRAAALLDLEVDEVRRVMDEQRREEQLQHEA